MKKILLMLSCCISTWCSAQSWLKYDTSSSANSSVPQRTIESVSDGVIVTYTFGGATITKDDLYPSSYRWDIDGFTHNSTVAEPAYLQSMDQVQIPSGGTATVTLLKSTYVDYKYELAPARPYLTKDNDGYNKNNVKPISSYSGFRPSSVVVGDDLVKFRGNNLQNVIVYPIQYNMQTKTVRAYKQIQYKVTYGTSLSKYGVNEKVTNDKLLKNTSISIQPKSASFANEPEAYLILTSDKYVSAANNLAAWKRLMGFKTFVVSKSSWTSSVVRSTIKSYYDLYGIQFMLIIGDAEDVPNEAGATYAGVTTMTDYNYCCMDGTQDKTADIHRGRLSVSSLQEALDVVNKIINYEQKPVSDNSFYKQYLCAAYFQGNSNPNSKETMPCIQTTEETIAYPGLSDKTPIRAYYANCSNPTYFYGGGKMPSYLLKPNYPWNANYTNITSAINSGVFLSTYNGHGNITLWGNPSFNTSHASSLTNGTKLPVMFNLCCLTGKYTKNTCLAEVLLRNKKGGAVAVTAAHEYSYTGVDDDFIKGVFDAFWPKSPSNEPIYRLGEAIDQGLIIMEQKSSNKALAYYTKNIYHCFGDPSMMLTTEVPTAFSNIYVTRNAGKITVTLANGDNGQITINDTNNGEVLTYYGHSYTFNLSNPNSTTVKLCVSGHNRIPYIKQVDAAPTGGIANFSYTLSDKTVTVDYVSKNVRNTYIRIYRSGTSTCLQTTSVPNASTCNRVKVSVASLPAGGIYEVRLYGDDTMLDYKTIGTPPAQETTPVTPTPEKSVITSCSSSSSSISVGYKLASSAKTAEIRVLSTQNGSVVATKTLSVNPTTGTASIYSSSLKTGMYAVVLFVNGSSVDGKNISVK